jgi:hypothetical protein
VVAVGAAVVAVGALLLSSDTATHALPPHMAVVTSVKAFASADT